MPSNREAVLPQTRANLFWSGGAYAITALLNFSMLFVLVKVLTPTDMAMIFIAIIFQDLAILFVDSGLGSYVVQAATLSQKEQSSLFWQGMLTGVLICLLLWFSSPGLAMFFRSPALTDGLRITALGLLPIALAFPQRAILQKKMHFRRIAVAELLGMIAAAVVTIGMAFSGWGFASYLYGFLARKTVELLVLWMKDSWMPELSLDVGQVRRLFGFGIYASGGVMSSYAVRLVDTFIVGRLLGAHALGLYSLANNLVFFPVSKCVATFSRVFISTFSHLKEDTDELNLAFDKALKSLVLLLSPVLVLLAIFIQDVMWAFFASAWQPVAALVRILIFNGFLILFLKLGETLLLACNRPKDVFWVNGLAVALTGILLLLLTPMGLNGAAWAVVLGAVIPAVWMGFKVNQLLSSPVSKNREEAT